MKATVSDRQNRNKWPLPVLRADLLGAVLLLLLTLLLPPLLILLQKLLPGLDGKYVFIVFGTEPDTLYIHCIWSRFQ